MSNDSQQVKKNGTKHRKGCPVGQPFLVQYAFHECLDEPENKGDSVDIDESIYSVPPGYHAKKRICMHLI